MNLYRIVKTEARASDLSGTGAFRVGGRWNKAGTYMLYASESSSLALLENLVHFDLDELVPHLYLIHIEVQNRAPVWTLPEEEYPEDWREPGLLSCSGLGDRVMKERKYLGLRVRSAVNPFEYNYLLNPLFPRYYDLVRIRDIQKVPLDGRLVK